MKTINRIFLLIVIFLSIVTTVKAQETMYIYKDGAVVGEHVLAEVDSVIFYQPTQGTITDNDGNEYQTVVIGTQTWMAENLKTTTYNDGTPISNVTDNTVWSNVTIGAYCWYNNDESSYKEPYGALYNWYAVETEKLCPSGWHVPSKTEWMNMQNYLINAGYNYDGSIEGNKIGKALGSDNNWQSSSNEGAIGNMDYPLFRNKTGFNAYAMNGRSGADGTWNTGQYVDGAFFWTSTAESETPSGWELPDGEYSWYRYLLYDGEYLGEYPDGNKNSGWSVRCIKD